MPVQTSYPGVYVQELPSGLNTIAGVSTSIAVFIGRTIQGPTDEPVQCLSYSDYVRAFTADTSYSDLARQVRLFFMNGGQECYVLRIVNTSSVASASATLNSLLNLPALVVTANSPGAIGNSIQITVDYSSTKSPESTFNLSIFNYTTNSSGQQVISTSETWPGLSMNPTSPYYALSYVNQNSNLVTLSLPGSPPPAAPTATVGYSLSGRPLNGTDATLITDLNTILATGHNFLMSVNGGSPVIINLATITSGGANTRALVTTNIQHAINSGFPGVGITVDTTSCVLTDASASFYLAFSLAGGDITITPAPANDISGMLMLGTNQGGIEKSCYADARPAPNGIVFNLGGTGALPAPFSNLIAFASTTASSVTTLTVNGAPTPAITLNLAPAAFPMYTDNYPTSVSGNSDGIRQKWSVIAGLIANQNANTPTFPWTAKVWGSRLAVLPASGSPNTVGNLATTAAIGGFAANLSYYNLGLTTAQGFQSTGVSGVDGNTPVLTDYMNAFSLIDTYVDIFNLMILAKDNTTATPTNLANIWGPASVFCQSRRALLLVDPPDTPDTTYPAWTTVQKATDPSAGVNLIRQGLVNDSSAIYFPRVTINENGLSFQVGPSGTMAGIMSRIDSNRGVWKAPAGTEANLLGVTGLNYKFTDSQNGVLNPAGINTLRIFPDGIVSWGARTLDGDDSFASQWKYVPVRRTAYYIEESLRRGLQWVVFEPNDTPLWSQIRLSVGSFMQGLFIQGAFQGQTKNDAYFVQCDSSTTTQNDINLGVVNIIVGFAPLKPAEFVVLSIQQMTGQVQV